MSAIKSNKLIPLLAIIAFLVVGFVFLKASGGSTPSPTDESPLEAAPAPAPTRAAAAEPPAEPAKSGGLLGGFKDGQRAAKPEAADADTPNESLKTLTAEVMAARAEMQRLTDENRQLRTQGSAGQVDRQKLLEDLRKDLGRDSGMAPAPAPASGVPAQLAPLPQSSAPTNPRGGLVDAASLLPQLPAGFGFEALHPAAGAAGSAAAGVPGADGLGPAPAPRMVLPMGVSIGKGSDGKDAFVRKTGGVAVAVSAPAAQSEAPALARMDDPATGASKKEKRYFTIPENATLLGATAMTAIVGRVPVDGRVNDPMQFKLVIGPDNLAANGHLLPRDLSGIIVSGIAIGDMNLQCSEGLVQSLTFVFGDGSIQTVSQRQGGVTPNLAGGGGSSGMKGLAQMSKLGYLSDRHGNPCIAGRFVTNAPAYLTDTIGLRALSLAGQAAAMAQTTVTNSAGYGGVSSSSTVTGSQGKYILGKTAAGATDEVANWLTKRMGNSFDAIVTPGGVDVVINIDQEIPIDKKPDARRLDYGRVDDDEKGYQHELD